VLAEPPSVGLSVFVELLPPVVDYVCSGSVELFGSVEPALVSVVPEFGSVLPFQSVSDGSLGAPEFGSVLPFQSVPDGSL